MFRLNNLYNDLLLKKGGVCNSLNKLDKDNINWLRYKILEIRNIKNKIFDIKYKEQKQDSINAYKDCGINLPENIFKDVTIPKLPEGIDEKDYILIFMDPSYAPQEVFNGIKFNKQDYTNSEALTIRDENRPNKPYAVWIQNNVQTLPEFTLPNGEIIDVSSNGKTNKNIYDLVNTLKKYNLNSVTLNERFIMELIYLKITKKHLDDYDNSKINSNKSYSICVASSFYDDCFPTVNWFGGKLEVRKNKLSHSDPDGRSRLVFF